MRADKAIVVPVNPRRKYAGGPSIGRVVPHIPHIRKASGVIWTCGRPIPREHEQIKTGYFYEANRHSVRFQFKIARFVDLYRIYQDEKYKEFLETYERYIPDFRYDDLIQIHDEFVQGRKAAFAMIITDIQPIEETTVDRFIKVSDGQPIRTSAAVRGHPVVYVNEELGQHPMVDFKSYIHDHLMKIIEEGLLDEEDVEDLLEYKLCESGYLLQGRQHSLENGGRIDLWYKKDDVSYVFEVKKARAEVGALNQIQAYIDRIKEKVKTSRLRGIIICETASKQLRDALDKARYDISIREYMFSVEFNFDVD